MSHVNSKFWNLKTPDSTCERCYYCMRYDFTYGTEYWCNIYDKIEECNTDKCLANEHELFVERSEHMTPIPLKRELLDSTCLQTAAVLYILMDFCHNTVCTNCPFTDTGNGEGCYFKKDSGLHPTDFDKLTEQLVGD